MTTISLIAAIDEAGGLGINNQLLCYLPADLQHFKTITMGKPIIMGRKTFESIGKPLPGRINIVLSRSALEIEGVQVVDTLVRAINANTNISEVFIIGGSEIFAQSMDVATHIYITRIHHHFEADVFFPTIDESKWQATNEEFRPHDDKNKFDMTFYTYERK